MAITAEKLRMEVEGDTTHAQKSLDELADKGSSIPNWVGKSKTALMGLFAVGVGGGLALGAGLSSAISGKEAAAKVKAELGLTEPESARIGKVAGDLFRGAYGDSIEDVNGSVAAVISSVDGMRDANSATLSDATADVMNFAKAFEVDVDRAAQIAGQAVRQGLAPDFDTAMDLMTASSQKVPKAVRGDLLDAVDEYGGFFSQIGISGEDAFSMLAAASEKGMYGIDKTGDAIKEFSVRMVESDKTATGALEGLGLNMGKLADDMAAGGERGGDAMQAVVDKLLAMEDPGARAAAAIDLFGAPLEDLGTDNIPKFLEGLKGVDGGLGDTSNAMEKLGEDITGGPQTTLTEMQRTLSGVVTDIMTAAIPAVMQFSSFMTNTVVPAVSGVSEFLANDLGPALQAIRDFVTQNSTALSILAGVIGAVFLPGLIAMGVQATITKVKVVASWVAQRAAAIGSVAAQSAAMARTAVGWIMMGARATAGAARVVAGWVVASAAAVANGAIMAATMAATAARVVAGWVLMGVQSLIQAARMAAAWLIAMGPIGWIIAAVVAVAALVIANWDKISKFTAKYWGKISDWVVETWEKITSWVSDSIAKVKAVITAVMIVILSYWRNVWNNVKSAATSVWNAIKSVIQRAIQNVLSVVNRVRQVIATIRNAFSAAKSAAQGVLNGLVGFVRSIPSKLVAIFTRTVGTFRRAGSSIINGLKDGIMGAFNSVRNAVSNGLSRVRNLLPFSPAKEGPFSGKGWTLYSGRSISEALAKGISDRAGKARDAAMDLAKGAAVDVAAPVIGAARGSVSRGSAGRTPTPEAMAGPSARGGNTFVFNTYNPVAEKEAVTANKTLARAAGLGW